MAETLGKFDSVFGIAWRETAPDTREGRKALRALAMEFLYSLPSKHFRFRRYPHVRSVRDFEQELAYAECSLRVMSLRAWEEYRYGTR